MKRKEASMSKFDFLAGLVLGALGMFVIMLVIMVDLNNEHDAKEISSPEVSETCEFHNAESIPKPSQASTPSPTPMPTPEPTPQPTVYPSSKPEVYVPYTPAVDVSECTDEELIAIADELVFRKDSLSDEYNPVMNPKVSIETDDPTEIAKEYLNLLATNQWTGYITSCNGFDVSTSHDEIKINGEPTGLKTNDRIYYDIAKELYMRGVWDGEPYELGNHTVSLHKYEGYILVDDYIFCHYQENLDLPDYIGYDQLKSSERFVLGKGTFGFMDGNIVRFNRGKLTTLGPIKSDGIDFSKYEPYRTAFWYNEASNTLFLITVTMPKDTDAIIARVKEENDVLTPAERKLVDGVGVYLYEIPYCNVSNMRFVSQITGYIQGDVFAYRDTKGSMWEYQEQNGKYTFVKLPDDPNTSKWFDLTEICLFLAPTFPYSPFYGYYCCCEYFCYEGCKSSCNCKYCN